MPEASVQGVPVVRWSQELPFVQGVLCSTLMYLVVAGSVVAGLEQLLGVVLALPLLLGAIAPSKKTFRVLFYFFMMSLLVGQRTIYITSIVRVYPQEIIITLLALLVFVFGKRAGLGGESFRLSRSVKAFVVLVCLGVFTGHNSAGTIGHGLVSTMNPQTALELGIYYAKGLLVYIPLLYCVQKIVTTKEEFLRVITLLLSVGLLLGLNGIGDRYGMGFYALFGHSGPGVHVDEGSGFARSATYWGSFLLVAPLGMMYALADAMRRHSSEQYFRVCCIAVQVSCAAMVLFSGHRTIWIMLMCIIFMREWRRGGKGICTLIVLAMLLFAFLPQEALDRFSGIYSGQQDSSTVKRIERLEWAYDLFLMHPAMGSGWGAAGLTHSDILQIGADTGAATSLSLMVFYGVIVLRLLRCSRDGPDESFRDISHAFFAALLAYTSNFLCQPHLNVQEVLIMFWVFLALGGQLCRLADCWGEPSKTEDLPPEGSVE